MSFVTSETGEYVVVHLDLPGVRRLIEILEGVQAGLERNENTHFHLFDFAGHELTRSKIDGEKFEANIVGQVDILGWNEESACGMRLKPRKAEG